MAKCRHIVGSFEQNPGLKRELKAIQERLDYVTRIKLRSEVQTRYAYLYTMLDSVSSNQKALQLMAEDKSLNHALVDYMPSKDDFEMIEDLANLLHPLYEFITLLGAKYYPTLSYLFPLVYSLLNNDLSVVKLTDKRILSLRDSLVRVMKWRFDYVINENEPTHSILLGATFLDFQFKKFSFIADVKQRNAFINKAKTFITNLFNKRFKCQFSNPNPIDEGPISSSLIVNSVRAEKTTSTQIQSQCVNNKRRETPCILTKLMDPLPVVPKTAIGTELKLYQDSKCICEDKDLRKKYGPLLFFKEHESTFPILSCMAKAIFCLMVTSTPIEGVYSGTGLIMTPRRCNTAPQTLQDLTLIHNNKNA